MKNYELELSDTPDGSLLGIFDKKTSVWVIESKPGQVVASIKRD